MITRPEYVERSKQSLQDFLDNNAHPASIDAVRDNILGFRLCDRPIPLAEYTMGPGVFVGSGLRITTDFVVTAHHVIGNFVDDWERMEREVPTVSDAHKFLRSTGLQYGIIDQHRVLTPIDITCFYTDPAHDLALVRMAALNEPVAHPINMREAEFGGISDSEFNRIRLIAGNLGKGKLRVERDGYVMYGSDSFSDAEGMVIEDTMRCLLYGDPGNSGGAIVDDAGNYVGTFSAQNVRDHTDAMRFGSSHVIKAKYVRRLVEQALRLC